MRHKKLYKIKIRKNGEVKFVKAYNKEDAAHSVNFSYFDIYKKMIDVIRIKGDKKN